MNKTINRLNQMINEVHNTGRSQNTMDLINNMLYLMSQNCNLAALAGSVIKLLAIPNLPLKKVVCSYLIRYSEKISDLSMLTTNSLRKDFEDPNPHVRKLVIKTACSIPDLKDLSLELLPQALRDSNACVRRTAAACCPKVISVNSEESCDIIDQLYGMIRDDDPLVVSNALTSLDEILQPEGGVVISYKMAGYLVRRMISFPDWCILAVCNVLKKYEPKNEDEVLDFLNTIDPKLNDRKPMVLLPLMDLTLSFIKNYNKNLEKDILNRVHHSLLLILNESCPEVLYCVIEFVENLIRNHQDVFSANYKYFLCNFNDPVCLKIKKLSMLPVLLQKNNASDIVEDTLCHLTNCKETSEQAVRTLAEILNLEGAVSGNDIEIVLQLMTSNHNNLVEEIVKLLSVLDLHKLGEWKNSMLFAVSENYSKIYSDDGKNALLCIIWLHGEHMDNVPYILEHLANDEEVMKNEIMYVSLLTASIKMFLSRPSEMQLLLGQILQQAKNSSSLIVKAQAIFYNSLLHSDLKVAAKILNC